MESLTNMQTQRGILSNRDVNTPTAIRTGKTAGDKTGSPEKPQKLAEASLQKVFKNTNNASLFGSDNGSVGAKRSIDVAEGFHGGRVQTYTSKRVKKEDRNSSRAPVSGEVSKLPHLGVAADALAVERATESKPHCPPDWEDASSPSSPASSFESTQNGLNDSQNTVLTEPDDLRAPMNREELRRKASTIKLRLRLASYKVLTNQIDLPISRLQLRTTSALSSVLPPLSQHQAPLPSAAASNLPNIHLQEPSDENEITPPNIASSPPPTASELLQRLPYTSPAKSLATSTRDATTTPLLPRQREGLLDIRDLRSPILDGKRGPRDLTSSVVKGRAADGLLSLMNHRN